MINRYSVHKIKDKNKIPFSPAEYSKFKFGCKDVAKKFGYELADGFIKNVLEVKPITSQIVVASSPYCFIPTATFAMKDYFIKRLNVYLVENNLNPVQETKISRTITYTEDYGQMTTAMREKLIGRDQFQYDHLFINNKVTLFLDDIRITGSHEKMILKMLDDGDTELEEQDYFLYFAELVNNNIHPKIENQLNYAYVKSLLDLDKIIKNENFLLNTRVVKYILNADYNEFKQFINYQPMRLTENIYHQAIGNCYHKIPAYKRNFNYIKKLITNK